MMEETRQRGPRPGPGEDDGKGPLTSASMARNRDPKKRVEELRGKKSTNEEVAVVNPTAAESYTRQGPGIGGSRDITSFMERMTSVPLDTYHRVLDIGFGQGEFLVEAVEKGCTKVAGVDIAQASLDRVSPLTMGKAELHLLDVSHSYLPWDDNTFNIVACTETLEHVANPIFMFSEIKRVLEPDGLLILAFPDPDDNLGYGGGQHAHCYVWFLRKPSFEIFMKQMFFKAPCHIQNGSSAWYTYRNYKGPGVVDVFEIISGNYDEKELFKCLE